MLSDLDITHTMPKRMAVLAQPVTLAQPSASSWRMKTGCPYRWSILPARSCLSPRFEELGRLPTLRIASLILLDLGEDLG